MQGVPCQGQAEHLLGVREGARCLHHQVSPPPGNLTRLDTVRLLVTKASQLGSPQPTSVKQIYIIGNVLSNQY